LKLKQTSLIEKLQNKLFQLLCIDFKFDIGQINKSDIHYISQYGNKYKIYEFKLLCKETGKRFLMVSYEHDNYFDFQIIKYSTDVSLNVSNGFLYTDNSY
jgi:hypothetical protein